MTPVEWLHATQFAAEIRESQFIYPLLQSGHIIGISMFAGSVALVNLRLAGIGKSIGLSEFAKPAMKLAWVGLALFVVTGLSMASAFVDVFVASTVMRIKLLLVLFAIGNAVLIQRNAVAPNGSWVGTASDVDWLGTEPEIASSENMLDGDPVETPANRKQLRYWAALGVCILMTIVTLGKLLAYIGGKD